MAKEFSQAELKSIYDFALDLGRRAGKILVDGVEKRTGAASGREDGKQEEKMNAVDIVTQTDLGVSMITDSKEKSWESVLTGHVIDVEAFVKDEINRRFPEHKYVCFLSSAFISPVFGRLWY